MSVALSDIWEPFHNGAQNVRLNETQWNTMDPLATARSALTIINEIKSEIDKCNAVFANAE